MTQFRFFLLSLFVFVLLTPLIVLAQASQPASLPAMVATAAWIIWLKGHWQWLLLIVIIPSVITGLSKFPSPTTNKIVAILQMIIDIFSFSTHKDSPNSLKLPFVMRSKPPLFGTDTATKIKGV
jgi:hypothetical protein